MPCRHPFTGHICTRFSCLNLGLQATAVESRLFSFLHLRLYVHPAAPRYLVCQDAEHMARTNLLPRLLVISEASNKKTRPSLHVLAFQCLSAGLGAALRRQYMLSSMSTIKNQFSWQLSNKIPRTGEDMGRHKEHQSLSAAGTKFMFFNKICLTSIKNLVI